MMTSNGKALFYSILVILFCFIFIIKISAADDEQSRYDTLKQVKTWMYQIQGLDEAGAVEVLAATEYDMLVLEPGHNFNDFNYETDRMIASLRYTPSGKRRLIIAYIDIGQAEEYRDYWGEDWVAPTESSGGFPEFLVTIDPDGWSGNYPVAYWEDAWKDLWTSRDGIVAELATLGFDGIYLDWVEAYDDEKVADAAEKDDVDPQEEMILFIEEMKAAGETIIEDFLVIPQNAPYLIDYDPDRYVDTIHALAVEDTWYHGAGDAEWDDPDAGDLQERHDDEWSTENRLKQYEDYLSRGLPVFSVDYCILPENATRVYDDALDSDLIPLVTRVSLSKLTETPPPSLGAVDPDGGLPVPDSQEVEILENPATFPDASTQPFAAWIENKELKMAADFSIYQEPVTLFLGLSIDHPEFSSGMMMFNGDDRLVIQTSGFIPWRQSTVQKHDVFLATIPTVLLPKGEYTFYSLVTSEPDTLNTYSIQVFTLTID